MHVLHTQRHIDTATRAHTDTHRLIQTYNCPIHTCKQAFLIKTPFIIHYEKAPCSEALPWASINVILYVQQGYDIKL